MFDLEAISTFVEEVIVEGTLSTRADGTVFVR
jgi:hypothetical protein